MNKTSTTLLYSFSLQLQSISTPTLIWTFPSTYDSSHSLSIFRYKKQQLRLISIISSTVISFPPIPIFNSILHQNGILLDWNTTLCIHDFIDFLRHDWFPTQHIDICFTLLFYFSFQRGSGLRKIWIRGKEQHGTGLKSLPILLPLDPDQGTLCKVYVLYVGCGWIVPRAGSDLTWLWARGLRWWIASLGYRRHSAILR